MTFIDFYTLSQQALARQQREFAVALADWGPVEHRTRAENPLSEYTPHAHATPTDRAGRKRRRFEPMPGPVPKLPRRPTPEPLSDPLLGEDLREGSKAEGGRTRDPERGMGAGEDGRHTTVEEDGDEDMGREEDVAPTLQMKRRRMKSMTDGCIVGKIPGRREISGPETGEVSKITKRRRWWKVL